MITCVTYFMVICPDENIEASSRRTSKVPEHITSTVPQPKGTTAYRKKDLKEDSRAIFLLHTYITMLGQAGKVELDSTQIIKIGL